MGVIITRKPWSRQPQGQVAANLHSQFAPRLRVLTCGPGLANLAGPSITKNAITSGARGDFTASIFDGSTSYGTHDLSDLGITGGGQGVTVLCRFVVDSLGGYRSISDIKDNNAGLFLRVNQSTGNLELDKNGQYALFNYSAGIAVGKVYTVCLSFVSSGNYACCLNGVQIASGSGDTTIGGTLQTLYIGRDSTASHYFSGGFGLFGFWTRALSGPEAIELSRNPWQLLEPAQARIWVPSAGGGNATATLAGAATASSAGTLTATGAATVTLSGAATTASAGTVSASASTNATATLTGTSTTASAGTLTATGAASITLTGAGTTANAGTVSATAGGNATATLTGTATTTSAGTLSATGGASKTLTGASTTASAGTVLASAGTNASVTLTGASTSAAVGALSASGAAQIVLTGVQVTAAAGSVTATGVRNASVTLTGSAVTSYAGAVGAYAGVLNVFTRPPVAAAVHGKPRQVAVLLSRPDRDIGNILKD